MIVIVQLKAKRQDGKPLRIPFETKAYDTIAAMEAALESGATIVGHQLIFERIDDVTQEIVHRQEKSFTAAERISIYEPRSKFIDRAAPAST